MLPVQIICEFLVCFLQTVLQKDVEKKTHSSGTEDRWYCRVWKCQERARGLSPWVNISIKLYQHCCVNPKYSDADVSNRTVICCEITGQSLRMTQTGRCGCGMSTFMNIFVLHSWVLSYTFCNLGQEASAWRVRVCSWRKRSHRHQCWHNWGWSLCIHVHSGVTGRTHQRENWLQASSWTSYATYPVWKFAVFIEWRASCVECQTFYNSVGWNIYVLSIKFI